MVTAPQRLRAQRLSDPGFTTPADVVRWVGAVQAQDHAIALQPFPALTGATARAVAAARYGRFLGRPARIV